MIACTTFTLSACTLHHRSDWPDITSILSLRLSMRVCPAKYKRTGRWEAHIWDSSDPGTRKGKQLHLGSFPAPHPAALCALPAMLASWTAVIPVCRMGACIPCAYGMHIAAC